MLKHAHHFGASIDDTGCKVLSFRCVYILITKSTHPSIFCTYPDSGSEWGQCSVNPGHFGCLSKGTHIENDNHSHLQPIKDQLTKTRVFLDCAMKLKYLKGTHITAGETCTLPKEPQLPDLNPGPSSCEAALLYSCYKVRSYYYMF